MASKRQASLNAAARQAGFRNDYHYRQVRRQQIEERPYLAKLRGDVARAAIGLRAGTARLVGKPGSLKRAQAVAKIAEAVDKAQDERRDDLDYDPETEDDYSDVGDYFDDVGSPKGKK